MTRRECIWLAAAGLSAQPQPAYSICAIQYATLKNYAVASLVAGADRSRKVDAAMLFWLIQGGGRNILFDCGFHHERFIRQWKPADYESPAVAVRRVSLAPEDITDVIISHIHWDHADGFDLFPAARVWIQKDELEYYAGEAWQGHRQTAADPELIVDLVKANIAGKVNLVNGDAQQIIPGITCYIGGKHTYQSQFLGVNTAAGVVVLASDNVYLNENLEKHAPVTGALDPQSNLRAQDRMKTLTAGSQLIMAGHDPEIMKRFPQIAPRVVKIQ